MSSATGKWRTVYADLPIRRECCCPTPVEYRDEDDDPVCFRCGLPIKAKAQP